MQGAHSQQDISDAMRDHAAACVLRPPADCMTCRAAAPLVRPDHLVHPFGTEQDPVLGLQPEAERFWTPPLSPQPPGDGATDTAGQCTRSVPELWLSGLRRALRLLKAVATASCVSS